MAVEITAEERKQLRRLEESLWREETRFDPDYMERVLADDFFEFGRSGRTYQRSEILSVPAQPIQAVIPLPNFHVRLLSEDVAQVTYNSHVTNEGVVEKGRRCSIWSRSPGGWVLRFHQGTPYSEGA